MREIDGSTDLPVCDPEEKLKIAFRPAYESRKVANWLFEQDANSFDDVFHSDFILPPNAFENAMAVQISQRFIKSNVSNVPDAFMNELIEDDNDGKSTFLSIHTLFIPSKAIDNFVVGYMFCLGQPDVLHGESPFLPNSVPDPAGRFVFDRERSQFLGLINSSECGNMCVIAHAWEGFQREKYIFTIPKQKYSFDHIPNTVLSVLSNEEYRLSCPKLEFCPEETSCSTLHDFQALDIANRGISSPVETDIESCTTGDILDNISLGATFDSMDGQFHLYMDDIPVLEPVPASAQDICSTMDVSSDVMPRILSRTAGPLEAKYLRRTARRARAFYKNTAKSPFSGVGGFSMSEMRESLGEIEKSLKGTFYGPQIRKETWNPQTKLLMGSVTGEYKARFDTMSIMLATQLRQRASQLYYAGLLSSVTDQHLVRRQICNDSSMYVMDNGEKDIVNVEGESEEGSHASKRPRVMANATLAPRPCVYPSIVGVVNRQAQKDEADEAAAREAKMEAKRRKNRLSAAKSNQKRKEKWDAQKKELEELQERVKELTDRRKVLRTENERLKVEVRKGEAS